MNSFSCVVLFASNLVLRHLKILNLHFSPVGHYFLSKRPKYCYHFVSNNLYKTTAPLVRKWSYANEITILMATSQQVHNR